MVVDDQGRVTHVHPSLIVNEVDANSILLAARTPRAADARTSARVSSSGIP